MKTILEVYNEVFNVKGRRFDLPRTKERICEAMETYASQFSGSEPEGNTHEDAMRDDFGVFRKN